MNVEPFALVTNDKAGAGGETALRNAWDFLRTNLSNAKDVVVISAYYGEEFIRNILHATNFSGKGRRLTFVFAGLPEVARDEQVKGLNQLRKDILQTVRCPAKNVDIRLAVNARFLHAKVLRFRSQGRLPVYMIGSANFSNAAFWQNDEVMVPIKGRHPGLNDYIKHVVQNSQSIDDLPAELATRSWRGFLRNAYLYYRPSRSIAYRSIRLRRLVLTTLRNGSGSKL